jgi:hypothetical protein
VRTMTGPVHTCPTRAVFQPNCPACASSALALAGADVLDIEAVPPAMATRDTVGCIGGSRCDCPFCPRGVSLLVQVAAPLPLPTGARLYRATTTRSTRYVWATSAVEATAILSGNGLPLGVPAAPHPPTHWVRNEGMHIDHAEPTPEWLAWSTRFGPYLTNRIDADMGECLIRVDGPYPV